MLQPIKKLWQTLRQFRQGFLQAHHRSHHRSHQLSPRSTTVEVPAIAIAPAPAPIPPVAPKIPRARLIPELLDEAWAQGNTTYPALMQYVKTQTGSACSRRAIANWKRARGLIEAV